jgi:integrase
MWKQLQPFCQDLWTRDVRTRHVQAILDRMAQTERFNINSLKHMKSFLSGVFRLALQQGYFDGANPVRETSLPQARGAEETYAYSLEEVLTMIDAVPEPAATLLATAAFTGARRGELRGMYWENYRDGELLIARSIWNGIATDPKSRISKAPIPVVGKLAARLALHRARQGNPMAGPMFPNQTGKPLDPNNLLRRVIEPALNVCEACSRPQDEHGPESDHEYQRNKVLPKWRGWHAFRRGLATNLRRLRVADMTIQRILRHSNVAVTQACYIKTASDESRAAMQTLETALTDTNVTPRRLSVIRPARA